MKRVMLAAIGVLGVAGLLATARSSYAGDRNSATHPVVNVKPTPVVPGVAYIKFKIGSTVIGHIDGKGQVVQSVGPSRFKHVMDQLGMLEIVPFDAFAPKDAITKKYGIDRMYVVYYRNLSIDPHTAIHMMQNSGEVECGAARYQFPIAKTPNDPRISEQYALMNMNVFGAWDHTIGDSNIVIADVDCAINVDHEDLKNSIKINWGEVGLDKNGQDKRTNGLDDDGDGVADDWQGVDVVGSVSKPGKDGDPRPDDATMSHGTETAGCIAATGDNGVGIAGIAYGCKLLAIKASDNANSITGGYEGIQWAITHGARIVNCSWGGPIPINDIPFVNTYLEEAVARNVLVVAAAGNMGANNDGFTNWPANGPGVLSVGASTNTDGAAQFSDFGHSVAVWAPGQGILSTTYPGNDQYATVDGTSFASPYTAGVAGLVMSLHPDWPIRFIRRQLVNTCDNVINTLDQFNYWGRVDASNAVAAPSGPGLVIEGYKIDGVANDSLGASGKTYALTVTFKNVVAPGSDVTAQLIPLPGYSVTGGPTTLGPMAENATVDGAFTIVRTGERNKGDQPFVFHLTDGSTSFSDTVSLYIPLRAEPGFSVEDTDVYGSSIKRVSNTAAWSAYGLEQQALQMLISQFEFEWQNSWSGLLGFSVSNDPPYCVEAVDSLNAWYGTSTTGGTSGVLFTNDGGSSFNQANTSVYTPFVNSIHFYDANNGILIGDPKASRWGILTTADGGTTWSPLAKTIVVSGPEASWNNSAAWVGTNGWFGSNHRHIWHTTDKGVTWHSVNTTLSNAFSIGFADDGLHGLAAFRPASTAVDTIAADGNRNGLMASSDGGNSWVEIPMPVSAMSPATVKFIPGTHTAFLSSDYGVYRTTDYGSTWTPVGVPTTFYADASDMSIYRGQGEFTVSVISSVSGIATYSELLPDEAVSQTSGTQDVTLSALSSAPNPLQNSSTITFAHGTREYVRLAVYDAIGREVAVLADGMSEPGSQSFVWDARNAEPGVYYCVLRTAGGAHISRAMTVLK